MSTNSFVVHSAIDRLPREPRRIVFQTVLADYCLMKIIMDLYDFYSNNTLVQLVLLWQNLNVSRLVLGDLPEECVNQNLSYATSDATRLIVLDLFYDHGFCSFIDRLPVSDIQYFLYPLIFSLSPTDMEYYFEHDEDAVARFLAVPYCLPKITAPPSIPRPPTPAPPTLLITRATSPTPPFEEPETPDTARPNLFPISLPSPIVPAVTWGEPPNWTNEDWDKSSDKENVIPPPEPQHVRHITGKLKRKRIPVFTFGDVLHRRPNTPPPFSSSDDYAPPTNTPSSSTSSLQSSTKKKCFKCKKVGHVKIDCAAFSCSACGELTPGHVHDDCPYRLYCIRCHERGHHEEDCRAHDWIDADLTDYLVNKGDEDF